MGKLKKTAIAIGGILGSYLLHFPARLLEDWVMGEIEGKIIENWQLYLGFFLSWILPFIVVFGAIWLGYWVARRPKYVSKSNIPSSEQIPPHIEAKVAQLIRNLHERMTKLKDEAVNRKITVKEIEEANFYVADALVIFAKNEIEDIIKKLRRLPNIKKKSKGELIELAKAELSPQLHKAQQRKYNIEDVEDVVKIGRILDGSKIGLARPRDRDKDWQRFYNELRFIKYQFADSELNLLIKEALDMSYGFNSLSLFIEYMTKHTEIEYFPPTFIQLGGGLDKIDIDTEIDKQITKIVDRIKELQKGRAVVADQGIGAIIKAIPVVYDARAKLEITNTGADAEFTATFRVVEGVPPAELYTMCWEPKVTQTRHIGHDETVSLLVGEISQDTVENDNIILSVFRGGLALFILGESVKQRIGASSEKTIEIQKLNQRYPTMRTTYENKCVVEITLTATPSLLKPFKRRYSLEIDEHNQLVFDEIKS